MLCANIEYSFKDFLLFYPLLPEQSLRYVRKSILNTIHYVYFPNKMRVYAILI